MTEFKKKIITR